MRPSPLAGAVVGAFQSAPGRDDLHFQRNHADAFPVGRSPGLVSADLRAGLRPADHPAAGLDGPPAAVLDRGHRRDPAVQRDRAAGSARAWLVAPGNLLRDRDGLPWPTGGRPPGAEPIDRVLSLDVAGRGPWRPVQRPGGAGHFPQRAGISADDGRGLHAAATSRWQALSGCRPPCGTSHQLFCKMFSDAESFWRTAFGECLLLFSAAKRCPPRPCWAA